jgi:hypothetical protein
MIPLLPCYKGGDTEICAVQIVLFLSMDVCCKKKESLKVSTTISVETWK